MDDDDDLAVDMGPLIDCVFLLLIFFLVSTTMKKPEQEIPVELPEPALSSVASPSVNIQVLAIDADGRFYWGAEPVGQQELTGKIREFAAEDPDAKLRIRVDRNASSRFLVQVLDLCAYEGLTNYALHTQDRNAPAAKEIEGR
ncbi:MAG TPA: biopolymer transporter ExbD [Opitutales bacterium]|nr:biopolymer transporter ExbD [Opitutales bacterium]